MKVLRILFAILLAALLFVSQAALSCLFVADRLVAPAALTAAVEGAGLMDSIVADLAESAGLEAGEADASSTSGSSPPRTSTATTSAARRPA